MMLARSAVFAAALAATSCGAPLLKLPVGPGEPAADGGAVLAEATAACRALSSISTEVAVAGSVSGSRVRGRLLTGLSAPDNLYMEAPAPFGAPLFVLGAAHGDATLLLPRDRRVLKHGRPEEVLSAVTGVTLTPADLRATLTGCAPSGRTNPGDDARAFGPEWRILEGDPVRYLRRERTGAPWRLVSVVRSGPEGWRADYSMFTNDVPRRIRLISTAPRQFDLRLELSQVELNVDLEPSTFVVRIPPGMEPITLEELRASGPLSR